MTAQEAFEKWCDADNINGWYVSQRDFLAGYTSRDEEVDGLKAEVDNVKQIEFPRRLKKVAANWRGKVAKLQAENAELRRQLEEARPTIPSPELLNKYMADTVREDCKKNKRWVCFSQFNSNK